MAGRAVQSAVIGSRSRLVIGADRVVRAQFEAPQSCVRTAPEISGGRDEAAERALVPGGYRVNQDPEAAGGAEPSGIP